MPPIMRASCIGVASTAPCPMAHVERLVGIPAVVVILQSATAATASALPVRPADRCRSSARSRTQSRTSRCDRCPACRPACNRTCRRSRESRCEYRPRRDARRSGGRSRRAPIRRCTQCACPAQCLPASPATDIRILNVDPGASCAWMALFISGWSGSVISLFQSRAVDLDGKLIGIEAGPRNHGQNLAVARVHGHDRAVAVAQRQLGRALQVVVDGQLQVLPGNRRAGCRSSPPRGRGCRQSRRGCRPARATAASYVSSTPALPTTSPGS